MAKVARQQAAEKEAGRSLGLIVDLARLFWDDVADRRPRPSTWCMN